MKCKISFNDAIHCTTEEEVNMFLDYISKSSMFAGNTKKQDYWSIFKEKTCFIVYKVNNEKGFYAIVASLDYCEQNENLRVRKFNDLFNLNNKEEEKMSYRINENEAIHCKTQEEANALFNLLSKMEPFKDVQNISANWSFCKEDTCFIYKRYKDTGEYHFDYMDLTYCLNSNIPVIEFNKIFVVEEENKYEEMSLQELKAECSERGIKFNNLRNKRYYIELLKEYDEEDEWDEPIPKMKAEKTPFMLKQEIEILEKEKVNLKIELENSKAGMCLLDDELMQIKSINAESKKAIGEFVEEKRNMQYRVNELTEELAKSTIENEQLKAVLELHDESLKNLEVENKQLKLELSNYKHMLKTNENSFSKIITENEQLKGYLEQYEMDKDEMVKEYETVINYLMKRMLG